MQDAADKIDDPIVRAQALKIAAANIRLLELQLRRAQASAIREAMLTRTAASVAAELDISRDRLYQILAEGDESASAESPPAAPLVVGSCKQDDPTA